MAKTLHTINLLPNKGERLAAQFFIWVFTIGRLLIILTETLALGVFLYRFSLDIKIVDLHDQIKAASMIVKNFEPAEKKFRNLQTRIALAKQADTQGQRLLQITHDIFSFGQGKVTFNNLIINYNLISLEVQANSTQDLSQFTERLKNYSEIQSLQVEQVANKTANAITIITLSATLKQAINEEGGTNQ